MVVRFGQLGVQSVFMLEKLRDEVGVAARGGDGDDRAGYFRLIPRMWLMPCFCVLMNL